MSSIDQFMRQVRIRIAEMNLTQGSVAKAVGMSVSCLGHYLRGNIKDPPVSKVIALATLLDISLDDAMGRKEPSAKVLNERSREALLRLSLCARGNCAICKYAKEKKRTVLCREIITDRINILTAAAEVEEREDTDNGN